MNAPSRGATSASPLRCAGVWAGVAGLLAVVVRVLLWPPLRAAASTSVAQASFEDLLVEASAVVGLLLCGWALVVTSAVTLTAACGSRSVPGPTRAPASWRGAPSRARRLLLLACGVALTSAPALPAVAAGGPSGPHHHLGARLDGLPVPDRAVGGVRRAPAGPATAPAPVHGSGPVRARPGPALHRVLVRPGDSLWSLAGASWQRLYRANTSVIGPDPDLILPGQELRLPPRP